MKTCFIPVSRACRLLLALVGITLVSLPTQAQTPFAPGASRAGRGLNSALPNEAVDSFAGTLSIVETDLVLPGNAGLDVRVQRVYNSAIYPGYQDDDLTIEEDSWAGIGWKLHFGRVLYPDAPVGGATQIEMGDGSRHALYTTTAFPEGWITKGFWRYDKATHTLKLPNGIVYVFGHAVFLNEELATVRYVTEIRDPFNNRITFTYFAAPGPPDGVSLIRQYLGGDPAQIREVTFGYDATLKSLASMSYGNRQWIYTQEAAGLEGFSVLKQVQPPIGAATRYTYDAGQPAHELTVLRAPGGGTVTYTYGDVIQQAGSVTIRGRGVQTRALGGTLIQPGTWTFSYGTGENKDTTRVECPCGTTTYRFNGIGVGGNFAGWLAGSLAEETVEGSGVVFERTVTSWVQSEPVSTDPTVGIQGVWTDNGVFKPLLASRVVTRGTQSWTTAFEYHVGLGNFNDYGRAWRIYQDGELHGFTTRTFQYGFTPYIVDRVANEEYRVGTEGTQSSWTYDVATGFLTNQALTGISQTFEPGPHGNVGASIDGLGNRATFTYTWGRVTQIQTPHVLTTYVVDPDGTVASEDVAEVVTRYEYDDAFRLTVVRPPGNTAPITYEYDNADAGYVIVRRHPSAMDSRFDGFGRVISTVNAVGLKARVERDACGRTTFGSYPYTAGTGTRGITTTYDELGRVRQVTDGDAVTQYAFDGIDVTVTDANTHQTRYDWSAFGSPGASLLKHVTDAKGAVTAYSYDVFNTLIKVVGPGTTPERTWRYDGRGLLLDETQPETGTTLYEHDVAGNLKKITDALGQVTTMTYDGNNRLKTRDAPGLADDLEVTYGGAGELRRLDTPTAASPTLSTVFGYDVAMRLSLSRDIVPGQTQGTTHTFESKYDYDNVDYLTKITYPSLRQIVYEPDAEGRTLVVKNNGVVFANNFTYSDSGQLAGYTTGVVTHTVTHDARDRVQHITVGGPTGLDLTYGYDARSQVTLITDARPGMTQGFDYDPVGRLTGGDGPWGALRWTYDPAGNRLTEIRGATTTYNYDHPTQRLTSTTGAIAETFTHDPLGRLTSDTRGQYTYNARGLLATVTKPGQVSASYGYDPSGLRITQTVNGNTTYSVRGVGGTVLSEYAAPCGAPVWARDLVYAAGRPLGAIRANLTPPSVVVTAATATVPEAATSVSVDVQLTTATGAVSTCPITVAYQTIPGTATVGPDFTSTGGTITFPAGTTSNTVLSVTVLLVPDSVNEPFETFTLALSSATGATVANPAGQVITIQDDDIAPAMAIEAPITGAAVKTPFPVTGWAIDESAPTGTGVDVIHVYATPSGGSPTFLGAATYGQARPDIGALYGSRFTNSGFTFTASLTPGTYMVTVYARSTSTGTFNQAQEIQVTVAAADPQMALDGPTAGAVLPQPFVVIGWAIDLGGSGPGVDVIQILAHPNPGSGADPILIGGVTYGVARPDVGQAYGAPYTNSGYHKEIRGLPPGVYRLEVQARSVVTGTFNQFRDVTVTVQANPQMWIDAPGPGTTIPQAFTVMGWAVDLAAATGTGVQTVHVWAYPNPGSGADPIFLGVAIYGGARPDIAAAYGSQFTNSGFARAATLAPGVYQIVAYAWSTVTGSFNQAQAIVVTVQ